MLALKRFAPLAILVKLTLHLAVFTCSCQHTLITGGEAVCMLMQNIINNIFIIIII